jgi:hypothetical protein
MGRGRWRRGRRWTASGREATVSGRRLPVAAFDLLGELGELPELFAPVLGSELAVGEDVLDSEPAVGADAVVGKFAAIEQAYEERPRDAEDVCGLVRRQLSVMRDQRDSQPLRHVAYDRP